MMTSPGYVPGSVPPHTADTASQLRNLEKQIDTVARKDLSRANVGQGGRLRGLYSDGSEAILFGVDPDDGQNKSVIRTRDGVAAFSVAPGSPAYGSKEQTTMRDLNGRVVYATDEVAGYGLSHPGLAYPVWGREELQPGNSAANAVVVAQGHNAVYNPVWFVSARMRLSHTTAGTSNLSVFLEIREGNTVLATSSTVVIPVTGVIITAPTFSKMCVIPADKIANGLTAYIKVHTPTPADFGVTVYPLESKGTSRALYDMNPSFQ